MARKSSIFIFITAALLATFLTPMVSLAATYTVAPNGNDNNPGTEVLPWKTIQKGCSSVSAGDTLLIRAGAYNEKVHLSVSGTASAYITISAYPGETAILDGTGIVTPRYTLIAENVSYVKISGLTLCNVLLTEPDGIVIRGKSSFLEIRNNTIYNIRCSSPSTGNGHAILILGNNPLFTINNIIIDSNEIYNIVPGRSEALTVNGNVQYFTVSNNIVHDIGNIGIDIAGHFGACSDPARDQARNGIVSGNIIYNCQSPNGGGAAAGLYVDGAKDILLERNIVHDTQRGLEVGCENYGTTTSGITVRDNIIYNNLKSGLWMGGYNPTHAGKVVNSRAFNNICYKNDVSGAHEGELTVAVVDGVEIKNNVFYGSGGYLLSGGGVDASHINNLQSDYNIWYTESPANIFVVSGSNYSFGQYRTMTGREKNSRFVAPLFVDAQKKDFHPAELSPVINAGDPSYVAAADERDFDGLTRVEDGRIDCGAFEARAGTTPPPPAISNVNTSAITQDSATVTWTTDQPADGLVEYGATSAYGSSAAGDSNVTSHTVTISGLSPATLYNYRVRSTNANNLESVSANYTFLTQAPSASTIKVDGSAQEWGGITSIATGSNGPKVLKAYNDTAKLFLLVTGNSLNTKAQFYIDSDNNSNTGYRNNAWSDSGADYLLESGILYRYTGGRSVWSIVGTADLAANSTVVEAGIPMGLMGIRAGSIIHIGYIKAGSQQNKLPTSGSLPAYTCR